MEPKKLIIFDVDGTLFRTETVDVEAFNKALINNGYPPKSREEILNLIGLTLEEIAVSFLNTQEEELLEKFKQDVIAYEEEAIITSGELYSGAEELLKNLKDKGFTLCICSNGNKEYITTIADKYDFNSLFDEIWYARKGITKVEAVKRIIDKFGVHKFVMVGDRLCDIEAAQENQGIAIGAAYGFGGSEMDKADYVAKTVGEVESIIDKLYE